MEKMYFRRQKKCVNMKQSMFWFKCSVYLFTAALYSAYFCTKVSGAIFIFKDVPYHFDILVKLTSCYHNKQPEKNCLFQLRICQTSCFYGPHFWVTDDVLTLQRKQFVWKCFVLGNCNIQFVVKNSVYSESNWYK